MLGLQVAAPADRVLKLDGCLFEQVDRFSVGDDAKFMVDDIVQAVQKALVDKIIEKGHFLRTFSDHLADDEFDQIFCQRHVIIQIRKGNLGFNHPELSCMLDRIGLLRPERWAKGVDAFEGHGKGFGRELATDRQACFLAEEILTEINRPIIESWWLADIQGRDRKHLSGAFGVTACNDRCMDIDKTSLIKETVDGESCHRTNPEHCRQQIGPRAQMSDGAQEFR